MLELENLNTEKKYSSKFLVEQINLFRKEEGNKSDIRHSDFLAKIELEFSEEIGERKISPTSYTDSSNRQSKCYELTFEESLQILMSESKSVRKKCVDVMKAQQAEITKLQKTPSYQIVNPIERAKAWIEEEEVRVALQVKNEKLQFRSDFVDVCFNTDSIFTMDEAVKILKLPFGRNTLFQKLREEGVLMKSNIPLQKYITNEYFKVIEVLVKNGTFNKIIPTTHVTQKGIGFIHKLYQDLKEE